jgi:hypothetical protein
MSPQFIFRKEAVEAARLAAQLAKTIKKGTFDFGTAIIIGTDGKLYRTPRVKKPGER